MWSAANGAERRGHRRVADGEEVGAEAADGDLDEGLEESRSGEGVAEADALLLFSTVPGYVGGEGGRGYVQQHSRPRSC